MDCFGLGWFTIHALEVVVLIQVAINGSRVSGGGIGNNFHTVPGYPKQSSSHSDFPVLQSVKIPVTNTRESNLIVLSKQNTTYQPNQYSLPLKFLGTHCV